MQAHLSSSTMKMWKKLRRIATKKKKPQQRVKSSQQEVHFLSKSITADLPDRATMDAPEEPTEIAVPALSFSKDRSGSAENIFEDSYIWNGNTNREIDKMPRELTHFDCRNGMSESRQDSGSISGSSVVSREISILEERSFSLMREAPPLREASINKGRVPAPSGSMSFSLKGKKKQYANTHHKFALKPKSIVRKWNRYADMEEKGVTASPRRRTKLAKSLHLDGDQCIMTATSSSDSNDDIVPETDLTIQEEGNLPSIQESCAGRDAYEDEDVQHTEPLFPLESGGNVMEDAHEEILCSDDSNESIDSQNEAITIDEDDAIHDSTMGEARLKGTIQTCNKLGGASISSISETETDSSNESMRTYTSREYPQQEHVVILSLAQILVQSYQQDPEKPGYWMKKTTEESDDDTKIGASRSKSSSGSKSSLSFARKESPLPTLNTFLAEVKARRTEIMTRNDQPKCESKVQQDEGNALPPIEDWYCAKRQSKQAVGTESSAQGMEVGKRRTGSAPNLLAELKAKQREIEGKSASPMKQKLVSGNKRTSLASANDLLSELKAKQEELKRRSTKKKETAIEKRPRARTSTDLMSELKAKQQEIKSRQMSPAKRPCPISCRESTASSPDLMTELKAKQREIEGRFYSRLAKLQSNLRGTEVVIIPEKS